MDALLGDIARMDQISDVVFGNNSNNKNKNNKNNRISDENESENGEYNNNNNNNENDDNEEIDSDIYGDDSIGGDNETILSSHNQRYTQKSNKIQKLNKINKINSEDNSSGIDSAAYDDMVSEVSHDSDAPFTASHTRKSHNKNNHVCRLDYLFIYLFI